jgi:phosphatidylserine/phosphatidylglycerophosphate/cardiolipin synthase-like enzyme
VSEPLDPIVVPGSNCWLIARADKASVIIDAADYYHHVHEAMTRAEKRILIIGWDFDVRIKLEPKEGHKSESLGEFFLKLARARPERSIDVLKWSFGAKKQFFRLSSAWMLWRWYLSPAIDFRFDSAHPAGCSHHQKIVVIDDALAVCGGIDMSTRRWDTPKHLDNDPFRRLPGGKAYEPWHDVTMMVSGDSARALSELGSERWRAATSTALDPLTGDPKPLWPATLDVHFTNVDIAIARTRAAYEQVEEIREIEALYLDMIAAAKIFIYIENQYLTSAKIAAAIAARMAEDNPIEIIVIMPRTADGWLEQKAMDAARIKLAREIAKVDRTNRFRIYVPVTQGAKDIYVHAKVAVVDDRFLKVGSSNMNNRSLGLDSEWDVIIDAALPANCRTKQTIADLRVRLLAEHLGVTEDVFQTTYRRTGSIIDTIETLRGEGKTLELLDLIEPGPLETIIAENELLDPEDPEAFLEPIDQRSIWKTWRTGLRWKRSR